jgi:hypothetical protein
MASDNAHFLIQNGQDNAKVDSSGIWSQILKLAKFQELDIVNSQSGTTNKEDNDVSITLSDFWSLAFSSQGNLAFYGPLPVNDTLGNDAWIGDNYGCR